MEISFITTSNTSQRYFIITSYMKYGWLWWRILDTGLIVQQYNMITLTYHAHMSMATFWSTCRRGARRSDNWYSIDTMPSSFWWILWHHTSSCLASSVDRDTESLSLVHFDGHRICAWLCYIQVLYIASSWVKCGFFYPVNLQFI